MSQSSQSPDSNTAVPNMPRHKRARMSDWLIENIPVAKTYQMYPNPHRFDIIGILKGVIAKLYQRILFTLKLTDTEYLHFMNHSYVSPAPEQIKHKHKHAPDLPEPQPQTGAYTDVAITRPTGADQSLRFKKKRKAKKPA